MPAATGHQIHVRNRDIVLGHARSGTYDGSNLDGGGYVVLSIDSSQVTWHVPGPAQLEVLLECLDNARLDGIRLLSELRQQMRSKVEHIEVTDGDEKGEQS